MAHVGGVGAGLQHHAVARGHRPEEGVQAQQAGVVPGGHDEGHPVGLWQLVALGGELGQRGGLPLGLGPPGNFFDQIPHFVQGQAHLAHVALEVGLVQVGLQSVQQNGFPGNHLLPEPFQGLDPDGHRPGGAGAEVSPLTGHGSFNGIHMGGGVHDQTSSRMAMISE